MSGLGRVLPWLEEEILREPSWAVRARGSGVEDMVKGRNGPLRYLVFRHEDVGDVGQDVIAICYLLLPLVRWNLPQHVFLFVCLLC